ncbi:hypothetical protein U1Q18_017983 [Sarracenia purpurea var. burkii]
MGERVSSSFGKIREKGIPLPSLYANQWRGRVLTLAPASDIAIVRHLRRFSVSKGITISSASPCLLLANRRRHPQRVQPPTPPFSATTALLSDHLSPDQSTITKLHPWCRRASTTPPLDSSTTPTLPRAAIFRRV